jgi:hypothetical protein
MAADMVACGSGRGLCLPLLGFQRRIRAVPGGCRGCCQKGWATEWERRMIKNLVLIVSGGALAFALAGTAGPAMAMGSVHRAEVTRAKLLMPDPTPIIRDSMARPGRTGQVRIWAQAAPPTIRDPNARVGQPGRVKIWAPGDPPVIRRSDVRPGGLGHLKLSAPPDTPTVRGSMARPGSPKMWAPADPPTVRDSNARTGDPDSGGQLTSGAGDPDSGGQLTSGASDPDSGGQVL